MRRNPQIHNPDEDGKLFYLKKINITDHTVECRNRRNCFCAFLFEDPKQVDTYE